MLGKEQEGGGRDTASAGLARRLWGPLAMRVVCEQCTACFSPLCTMLLHCVRCISLHSPPVVQMVNMLQEAGVALPSIEELEG